MCCSEITPTICLHRPPHATISHSFSAAAAVYLLPLPLPPPLESHSFLLQLFPFVAVIPAPSFSHYENNCAQDRGSVAKRSTNTFHTLARCTCNGSRSSKKRKAHTKQSSKQKHNNNNTTTKSKTSAQTIRKKKKRRKTTQRRKEKKTNWGRVFGSVIGGFRCELLLFLLLLLLCSL